MPQDGQIEIWLHDPMSQRNEDLLNNNFSAGIHTIQVDLFYGDESFDRTTGIVRIFIDFVDAPEIPIVHGDIQIIE